jgi:hypothetical protein
MDQQPKVTFSLYFPQKIYARVQTSVFCRFRFYLVFYIKDFICLLFCFISVSDKKLEISVLPYLLRHCPTVDIFYGIGTERCSKEMILTLNR